jgi:hypothetical protein
MSVTSMARIASRQQNQATRTTFKNALVLVAAYIPSEALAVYLAALGLLVPATDATAEQVFRVRIVCFVIGFGMAVFLAFAAFDGSQIERKAEARRRRIVVSAFAALAFMIYCAATPDFFFSSLKFLTIAWSQWAAVVAIVAASVLPYFARALKIRD